jgi:hypothetical protein
MPEYTSARIKLPTKAFLKEFKKTHKDKSEDDIINIWRLGYEVLKSLTEKE